MKVIDPDRFAELWIAGVSQKEMAAVFGCSRSSIESYRRHHTDLSPRMEYFTRHAEALEMFRAGKSSREIADALGVHVGTIKRALRAVDENPRRNGTIDRDLLRQMWADDATLTQIAARMGCSRAGVQHARRVMGLPPRETGSKAPKTRPRAIKREDIEPLWGSGMPAGQIARTLGVNEKSVWRARQRFDLPLRGRRRRVVRAHEDAPKWTETPDAIRIAGQLPDALRPRFVALVDEVGLPPREALRRLYAAQVNA